MTKISEDELLHVIDDLDFPLKDELEFMHAFSMLGIKITLPPPVRTARRASLAPPTAVVLSTEDDSDTDAVLEELFVSTGDLPRTHIHFPIDMGEFRLIARSVIDYLGTKKRRPSIRSIASAANLLRHKPHQQKADLVNAQASAYHQQHEEERFEVKKVLRQPWASPSSMRKVFKDFSIATSTIDRFAIEMEEEDDGESVPNFVENFTEYLVDEDQQMTVNSPAAARRAQARWQLAIRSVMAKDEQKENVRRLWSNLAATLREESGTESSQLSRRLDTTVKTCQESVASRRKVVTLGTGKRSTRGIRPIKQLRGQTMTIDEMIDDLCQSRGSNVVQIAKQLRESRDRRNANALSRIVQDDKNSRRLNHDHPADTTTSSKPWTTDTIFTQSCAFAEVPSRRPSTATSLHRPSTSTVLSSTSPNHTSAEPTDSPPPTQMDKWLSGGIPTQPTSRRTLTSTTVVAHTSPQRQRQKEKFCSEKTTKPHNCIYIPRRTTQNFAILKNSPWQPRQRTVFL